jgi:hypothetical protein
MEDVNVRCDQKIRWMDTQKEIYYINFKVQLVTFKVVPFAIRHEDTR